MVILDLVWWKILVSQLVTSFDRMHHLHDRGWHRGQTSNALRCFNQSWGQCHSVKWCPSSKNGLQHWVELPNVQVHLWWLRGMMNACLSPWVIGKGLPAPLVGSSARMRKPQRVLALWLMPQLLTSPPKPGWRPQWAKPSLLEHLWECGDSSILQRNWKMEIQTMNNLEWTYGRKQTTYNIWDKHGKTRVSISRPLPQKHSPRLLKKYGKWKRSLYHCTCLMFVPVSLHSSMAQKSKQKSCLLMVCMICTYGVSCTCAPHSSSQKTITGLLREVESQCILPMLIPLLLLEYLNCTYCKLNWVDIWVVCKWKCM